MGADFVLVMVLKNWLMTPDFEWDGRILQKNVGELQDSFSNLGEN